MLSVFNAWAGWTAYAMGFRRRLQADLRDSDESDPDINASDSDESDPDAPPSVACVFIQVPRDPAGERFMASWTRGAWTPPSHVSSVWRPSSLAYRRRPRD